MAWDFSTEREFEEKLSCNASTLVIEEDLTLHMEAGQWCRSQEAVARSRNPYGGPVQIRGKQVHSFLATSGPVMRASSGKAAVMMPRAARIPPAVMR